jgi:hypothetical protein
MRVGLVLGAGGVQGGAWLTGALDALAEETGWDPATADHVIGTSAGSVIGSLCVAGIPPWFMVAHSAGETFEGVTDARGRPQAEGLISTEPVREIVRTVVPAGWTEHPAHWVVACDYSTGRRIPFGRAGAPLADLPDATSSLHPVRALDPREWPGLFFRRASGRRLGSEAKKLRARGTEVVLVQPTGEDLHVISRNLMSTRNRNRVIETARRTVAAQLAEPANAELLAALEPGDPRRVRRPDGPPSGWPHLDEIRAVVAEHFAAAD